MATGYLFIEVLKQGSANLTWGGQIALFILFVISTGFLIRQNYSLIFAERRITRSFAVCALLFAFHLLNRLAALL